MVVTVTGRRLRGSGRKGADKKEVQKIIIIMKKKKKKGSLSRRLTDELVGSHEMAGRWKEGVKRREEKSKKTRD